MYRNERRRGASHIGTALCGSQREVLCGSVASSLALLAAAALRMQYMQQYGNAVHRCVYNLHQDINCTLALACVQQPVQRD